MKDRLLQLLDLEHLTPSKFADLIGVQRSSVSHILSDRNKPSFDFLQKTLKTFPGLKAEWLMLGEGPMYDKMGRESQDLFSQAGSSSSHFQSSESANHSFIETSPPEDPVTGDLENPLIKDDESDHSKKVIRVMLLFDDDTFLSYKPSQ